jgi:glycerol-3-phosphate dehydrogenase (NAD(P)+)
LQRSGRKKDERHKDMEIVVIGAGGWGTAIAKLLAKRHEVNLWVRNRSLASEIEKKRENRKYLPGIKLPSNLEVFTDLERINQGEVLLMAVPSFAMREVACRISKILSSRKAIVNLAKGIEQKSFKTMSEVLREELGVDEIFTLSGPSHAEEVGRNFPTTVVIAGQNIKLGKRLQAALTTDRFRVYLNTDIKGVEYAGALKNVIALATGISDGLGYGDNARGALISRGLAEIVRLGMALGGRKETFFGLAGLGDLVATCTSTLSRNRLVGFHLGGGKKLKDILAEMDMVAEGIYTVKAAYDLARRLKIDVPITKAVYEILYREADPLDKLKELMARKLKMEEV